MKIPRGKHTNHRRGVGHYRWNCGTIMGSNGYRKVRVGKIHPLADSNGYAYEHRVVWCSWHFLAIPRGMVVHHKNGNKLDNRAENLELISRGQHNAHHNQERGRDEKGQFKKAAGRFLDGKLWDEFPDQQPEVIPCPGTCGGCSCFNSPPCDHCVEGHGQVRA